jgi:hypothetical protein
MMMWRHAHHGGDSSLRSMYGHSELLIVGIWSNYDTNNSLMWRKRWRKRRMRSKTLAKLQSIVHENMWTLVHLWYFNINKLKSRIIHIKILPFDTTRTRYNVILFIYYHYKSVTCGTNFGFYNFRYKWKVRKGSAAINIMITSPEVPHILLPLW